MALRCMIIDDDEMARAILKRYISGEKDIEFAGEYNDPIDAMQDIREQAPDLVFLDIEMPRMDGMEFLKLLGSKIPNIILTTSHKEFAVEAFKYNVIGYLLKPVQPDEFAKAVSKFRNQGPGAEVENPNPEIYFFKRNNTITKVGREQIQYIECVGDYANVQLDNDRYVVHGSMRNMESRFSEPYFIRVHRSFIVPVNRIDEIEDDVIMIGEKMIPIGKTYKQSVYKRLHIL